MSGDFVVENVLKYLYELYCILKLLKIYEFAWIFINIMIFNLYLTYIFINYSLSHAEETTLHYGNGFASLKQKNAWKTEQTPSWSV